MFTPQRKGGWSLTPKPAEKNAPLFSKGATASGKGKAVAGAESAPPPPPPPPQNSLFGENGGGSADGGGNAGEAEVWRRFREAGMLDEASLERKDREALLERIAKLEGELYDYQYNMGLLLIEKKDWTAKYEEFRQGLIETEEMLKREQASHLVAVSELEKREENLKKALGVEKQCVAELEKALREMRAGQAEVKFTSDQKLADAQALMANVEEKSLEVEAKLRSADARLAEISRKSSEVERRSLELVARESILQRERASLHSEKELHVEDLARQREDLRVWEKNLREGQERLVESQELLNQREKRSNEGDKVLMKKEKELDVMREAVEKTTDDLKEKEDYINLRLTALADKEKEADVTKECLEKKEKELLALEEKLIAREQVEIQKLLDEHNSVLNAKKHEFEKEMEIKRKSLDESLQEKLASLEKMEKETSDKEKKLVVREKALERKMVKLEQEQKDLGIQSKALKVREQNINNHERELEKKSKQLDEDKEKLVSFKAKIETERKAIEAEKARLLTEKENLKITEKERAEYTELQSKLKQEIEECRLQKELLIKEREELRQDRENFEKEWEALDEKRAALDLEAKQVNDERERLAKWKQNEQERLENELQATRDSIQRELDELKLKKDAFEAMMELERSEVRDKLQQEREDLAREFDIQKHELEIMMQKKLEESTNKLQLEVAEFNKMREAELERINSLRDSAVLGMQKMKVEQDKFEREKQEYISQRNKLEEAQLEIRNDIDSLRALSRNLKNQREEFVKEREHFLALVEKYKTCQNCGVTITEFAVPYLQPLDEIEDPERALLPSLANDFLEGQFRTERVDVSPVGNGSQSGASGGRMSWLRSCTKKIFSFSPGKRAEDSSNRQADKAALLDSHHDKAEISSDSSDSFDAQRDLSNDQIGAAEGSQRYDKAEEEPNPSLGVGDNTLDINRIQADNGINEIGSAPAIPPVDGQNEISSLPSVPEESSQPPKEFKQKVQRRGKAKAIKRTHSVQEVVKESEVFLKGKTGKDGQGGGESLLNNKESQADSVHTDLTGTSLGQKRRHAETSGPAVHEPDGASEAHSESVSLGGRRKRRQTAAPTTQAAGDRRYNLRRSTVTGGQTKGVKTRARQPSPPVEESHDAADKGKDIATKHEEVSAPMLMDKDKDEEMHMLQRSTTESIVQVHEISLQVVETGEEGEEVNGAEAATAPEDGEYATEDAEEEDAEGSDSEKHNASIGKKIWTFFTT